MAQLIITDAVDTYIKVDGESLNEDYLTLFTILRMPAPNQRVSIKQNEILIKRPEGMDQDEREEAERISELEGEFVQAQLRDGAVVRLMIGDTWCDVQQAPMHT